MTVLVDILWWQSFVKNAPLDEVKALLASQNLPTHYIDVPFTPFLIVSGNQRYLMDTGFANNGGPTTGKMIANMAAAGYKPEDINNVVISHFHGDHINGLLYKDGSLVYPMPRCMFLLENMLFGWIRIAWTKQLAD